MSAYLKGVYNTYVKDNSTEEKLVLLSVASIFLPFFVTAAVLLFVAIRALCLKSTRKMIFSNLSIKLVAAFAVLNAVAPFVFKNWLGVACYVGFTLMLVFALYLRSVVTDRLFNKIGNVIAGMSIIPAFFSTFISDPRHEMRSPSFFFNPNILAVYLLLYFPFALWGIFLPQAKGGWRWFYTASVAFCVLCILLTWSRGAWLGLFLECLLFLLFHSKKSRIAALFLPLLVLLSIPVLPQNFRGRLFSIGDLGESSVRYRLLTWRGTLRMFREHPFGIGVGERAWRLVYSHYAVSGTQRVMHAHNLFLQVACEVGIVGLVLFLLIIVIAVLRGWREKKRAALVALAGTLVMGMFDHLWYYPGLLVPFWSILALCTPNV